MKFTDRAEDIYALFLHVVTNSASTPERFPGGHNHELFGRVRQDLSRTHLFEGPTDPNMLTQWLSKAISEHALTTMGIEWANRVLNSGDHTRLMDYQPLFEEWLLAMHLPPVERRPFGNMLVTFPNQSWNLHPSVAITGAPSEWSAGLGPGVVVNGTLDALLITPDRVVSLAILYPIDPEGGYLHDQTILRVIQEYNGTWDKHALAMGLPLVVNRLLAFLYEHRTWSTTKAGHLRQRRGFRRWRAPKGWIPRPFYTIQMDDRFRPQIEKPKVIEPGIVAAYRTERRAHEMIRYERGPLPMTDEWRKKLKRRSAQARKRGQPGYLVLESGPTPERILKLLQMRQIPDRGADEWLAVKITHRTESLTSNDDSLPYVPATHKSSKWGKL